MMLHPAFTPVNHISAHNRTGFTKKICLRAADWGGLRALNDDSRLRLSFSALFCRPFFAQTKRGVPPSFKKWPQLYKSIPKH